MRDYRDNNRGEGRGEGRGDRGNRGDRKDRGNRGGDRGGRDRGGRSGKQNPYLSEKVENFFETNFAKYLKKDLNFFLWVIKMS
jgi:hypothetical protein